MPAANQFIAKNGTGYFAKMSDQCRKSSLWTKYSESRLVELEQKILTVVKTAFKTWFVSIGATVGNDDKIWTISLNEESKNTPLVLLHGFAAGIGFWCMNYDEIAKDRPVYAIDLLGFGRSSRPKFAKECEDSEKQMVEAIEAWRQHLKLDKFILLGHSFGGYLATSYAIHHPDRVKHLILADPWGFADKPANFNPPMWLKVMGVVLYPFTYFNPLATVRAAGPFGPWLVKKMRTDISKKYEEALDENDVILEYIYQCNSQYPSGETAFHSFVKGFAWAKNPMIHRFDKLRKDVPITVVYGEHSWINKEPGAILQDTRSDSYVNVEIIPDAGHHLYSDQPKLFNKVVLETCRITELSLDKDNTVVKRFTVTTAKQGFIEIPVTFEKSGDEKKLLEYTEEEITETIGSNIEVTAK